MIETEPCSERWVSPRPAGSGGMAAKFSKQASLGLAPSCWCFGCSFGVGHPRARLEPNRRGWAAQLAVVAYHRLGRPPLQPLDLLMRPQLNGGTLGGRDACGTFDLRA